MKIKKFEIKGKQEVDCIYIEHYKKSKEICLDFLKKNKKEDWEELGYYSETIAKMFITDANKKDMNNIFENLDKICGKSCEIEYEPIDM